MGTPSLRTRSLPTIGANLGGGDVAPHILPILPDPTLTREVSIGLCPEDFASVRFAISPLWECVAAFRAWMNPQPHALLLPWIGQLGATLRNRDWRLLTHLALVP